MTDIYDKRGVGPKLDLHCPHCDAKARFIGRYDKPLPVSINKTRHGITAVEKSWRGHISCLACGHNGDHDVDWPSDAYYQVAYKGESLHAECEAMAQEMLAYLAARADRDTLRKDSVYALKLMRVPALFLTAKARDHLVRQLERLLKSNS